MRWLILAAVLAALAYLLFARHSASPAVATVEPPHATARVSRALAIAQPTPAVGVSGVPAATDYDVMAGWKQILAVHEARAEGSAEWKKKASEEIFSFFERANLALQSKRDFAPFHAKVSAIECRDGSCLVQLQFPNFSLAMAYVEMVQIGRLAYDFNVTPTFECPLLRAAIPDGSNTALVQYDCVPPK